VAKNVWAELAQATSQNGLQFIFMLMGGGCIPSISFCQPLHAVEYPFVCPNIVCRIAFPNTNQTHKRDYPSQLEKISR